MEDNNNLALRNSQKVLDNFLRCRSDSHPTTTLSWTHTPSMDNVMKRIDDLKEQYKSHPLFLFLADPSIDPMHKFSFVPQIAFFIMSFGDLNKYVFRYTDHPQTEMEKKRQNIINQHTLEDDHHWQLFLEDVEKLGFNDNQHTFGSFLSFMWSEETQASRRLTYDLAQLSYAATDPVLRFVMIEAIEATGNVLFNLTTLVAEQLVPKVGELRYFGKYHLQLETGHLVASGTDTCGCDHEKENEVFGNTEFDMPTFQKSVGHRGDCF